MTNLELIMDICDSLGLGAQITTNVAKTYQLDQARFDNDTKAIGDLFCTMIGINKGRLALEIFLSKTGVTPQAVKQPT